VTLCARSGNEHTFEAPPKSPGLKSFLFSAPTSAFVRAVVLRLFVCGSSGSDSEAESWEGLDERALDDFEGAAALFSLVLGTALAEIVFAGIVNCGCRRQVDV
jgi:hypothetical protein